MKVSEAQAIIDYYHAQGMLTDKEAEGHAHCIRYAYLDTNGVAGNTPLTRSNRSRARWMAEYFGAESITI